MSLKKKIYAMVIAGILIGSTVLGMTGCSDKKLEEVPALDTESMAAKYHADKVTYRTVTSGEDWGPAITQVILNFGTQLSASSVQAESFQVSSVRTYGGVDDETGEMGEPVPHVVERNVLNAYVSDENGVPAEGGSYVTLDMEIAPYLAEGSPFVFNILTYQNEYVETSYEISLRAPLATADGLPVTMETTNAKGYVGNKTLLAEDFDTEGTYTYTNEDGGRQIDLTYASWFPEKENAEGTTPLIIWLHGAGEGGTDPNVAILGNKVVNLATEDIQQYFGDTGAAVLAPQSPTMWMDTSGQSVGKASLQNNTGESYYTEALMSLITSFVEKNTEIDPTRIYLGGCSNGGYMTLNLLIHYPGVFAAAFPVCEPYANEWLKEEKLSVLAEVPMWLTAAKTDTIVTIYEGYRDEEPPYLYHVLTDDSGKEVPINEYSNALYERLQAAGAEVYYSLFDNVVDTSGRYVAEDGSPYEYNGHWSWIYTLNNACTENIDGKEVSLFEWLAGQ